MIRDSMLSPATVAVQTTTRSARKTRMLELDMPSFYRFPAATTRDAANPLPTIES